MTTETQTASRRRASFHNLTVAEVRRLTDDAIEVTFGVPAELAGQYDYLPGQYVALRTTLPDENGEPHEVRRSYSICAEPRSFEDGSSEIRVAIKKDLGGLFSTWANAELKAGDVLDVMSPQGAFISRHGKDGSPVQHNVMNSMNHPEELAGEPGNFVAIAAGSGITPVIAIARTLLAANPETTFDLVYANKAAMDVMFLEELADLKDKYPTRLALHHVLSREQRIAPLMTGRIDSEKLQALLSSAIHAEDVDEWFLCGPFELVQLCRDTLAARGVEPEHVRFELFTTGRPDRPEGNAGRPVVEDESQDTYKITFTLDGLTGDVASPTHARESILNAALRVRPDVPFACAGGVCGTCRAKLITGTVTMDENYALEQDELDKGYVLTCQSHPTSEEVTVDFDV
ncbi:ring-1,2-phenylacetyl-CoA epoxidase subunit PaaE [Paenarthrobacter nicotinovorans]|jgi:ring-1,2-phenylacetyl-CoA epoxidase subunit PaaE|uniref:Ring-1,2-phenylacetyl-CoA epoxidase subunit PaaE n=1 Tax=Paenarthrobacter nicotinovorans TaxID=29320 RepID=A0ABT9TG54_PAENI|nr:1,2-phenylacetyl-CoA epoxidase subunit PaaE [Paenarthrobacter nicotinovorans]SKB40243.1 ring-1,2-phenylacetyl-CoA epoxidase subunit PaaE [Arthrobacter sp. 31Cvi3.1E]BCW11875.1 phenylacetic acid degradation protein [Arthrobacter sp. NtRootA2]BCW15959.1 phenylacetic acid degradation protein [Arthrobacter sp. NtRootA4]BCW24292.1 phenylacetic acid degradation protein [Arthrobacter sp. NtRootC7]BCW28559.1 phenylacetic acid degradation protein [Arthrobacter sp. NtRootC45]BCW32831.1 phenylacetic 